MFKPQHYFICLKCGKRRHSNIKGRIICQKCIVNENKEARKEGEEKQTKLL